MLGKLMAGLIVLAGVFCAGGRAEALSNKRMIGELERLGKDGRDWLVLGAEADGFENLMPRAEEARLLSLSDGDCWQRHLLPAKSPTRHRNQESPRGAPSAIGGPR